MLDYWNYDYAIWLYQFVNAYLQNEYATAGLLGNIYAESNICPYRQQGLGYTDSWNLTVNNFRKGTKNNFVYYDGNTGYSLAQWTTYKRRINYYDSIGGSTYIGAEVKSAQFLIKELTDSSIDPNYVHVFNHIKKSTSIEEACDYVMVNYEAPKDQSESAKENRRKLARQLYQDMTGKPPQPPPTPIGNIPIWLLKKLHDNNYGLIY